MGNLIIKPNTGGLLKLQDEGGSDAISISTTGNTTLAGTANAIGTVTAGNLSNSSIVYPDGHVVQVASSNGAFNGGGSLVATGDTATDSDAAGFTVSNLTGGNYLFATVTGGLCRTKSSPTIGYVYFGLVFKPNTGSSTTVSAMAIYSRIATVYLDYAGVAITCAYPIPSGVTSVIVKRTLTSASGVYGYWASGSAYYTPCVVLEVLS